MLRIRPRPKYKINRQKTRSGSATLYDVLPGNSYHPGQYGPKSYGKTSAKYNSQQLYRTLDRMGPKRTLPATPPCTMNSSILGANHCLGQDATNSMQWRQYTTLMVGKKMGETHRQTPDRCIIHTTRG